jgi:hypothetical protein
MGSLTPNASLVYEHVDGITFARERGAPVSSRVEVGRTYDRMKLDEQLKDDQLWGNIRRAAVTNPALQEAIERVKITYYLTEDYEKRYGRKT